MQNIKSKLLLSKMVVLGLLLSSGPVSNALDGASKGASLKGGVTENQLIDNLERVGIKCNVQQLANGKHDLIVQNVRLGSNAYYKGVAEGDKIKGLKTATDIFTLSIERNGQLFAVQLRAMPPEFASATRLNGTANQQDKPLTSAPLMDVSENRAAKLEVNEKEQPNKLIPYDIELIVDITGSMGQVDGTGTQTKFQWCHEQVRNFAKILGEYQKSFTITTFNTTFHTDKQCDANHLESIYASITPTGNTDLVDPLMTRLQDAYDHRAPGHKVLIAVITDGLPNKPKDPTVVNRALIDFTKKMKNPDEVVITFLQIGDTFEGKDFCIDLDDHLVAEGAKYDIIDTRTFDELKESGMVAALVAAITEQRSTKTGRTRQPGAIHMSATDTMRLKKMDRQLDQKQQEREALENILHVKKPNK